MAAGDPFFAPHCVKMSGGLAATYNARTPWRPMRATCSLRQPIHPERCVATFTVRSKILLAMLCLPSPVVMAACPPAGYDLVALEELKARHFEVPDTRERQILARNMLACLYVPDAKLRDRIAYEAYATWRYNKALEPATWKFIETSLVETLHPNNPDPDAVIRPFAVLVLAEAVKANRAAPYLSDEEQRSLLHAAANYLTALRDYRGFDNDVGWRHGVAHAADLLAQLALSPGFGKTELKQILAAIAAQVVAADAHFYVYGEGERLASAVVAVASREVYTAEEWSEWLMKIGGSAPFENWDQVYWGQPGLAKRHDTMSFLLALYAQSANDKRSAVALLAPMALKAMQPLG